MNEVKRLRLQSQIFRHVVRYYQKMSGAGLNVQIPVDAINTTQSSNPFELASIEDITDAVHDYATFTRCELSSDASFARIFVNIWGSPHEQDRTLKEIRKHIHGMRSSIAKHIRMRVIPNLDIVKDDSLEKSRAVEKHLS